MADAIELLESGSHANVATVYAGVTPQLAGHRHGAVPLASQVKGDAVDVSAYSTLKIDLSIPVDGMVCRHGWENGRPDAAHLYVSIEHLLNGTWQLLHAFPRMNNPGTHRAVLTGFGDSVRTSYYFSRGDMAATINDAVAFTFSVTGEALPEA